MSSVGEAKEKIAAASEETDEAIQALDAVEKTIESAVKLMADAADDSEHQHVQDALAAYSEATGKLVEIKTALAAARDAGEQYAVHLG